MSLYMNFTPLGSLVVINMFMDLVTKIIWELIRKNIKKVQR